MVQTPANGDFSIPHSGIAKRPHNQQRGNRQEIQGNSGQSNRIDHCISRASRFPYSMGVTSLMNEAVFVK
jgi:hypothetical protein